MNLAYESLGYQLHQRFPQLAEQKYTSLIDNINVDTEPFVLYGVIFNRYLIELANCDDDKSKKDVATFLEEMAASSDGYVIFLLTSELLPTLVKDQVTIDAFWLFLGPRTRHFVRLLPPRFVAKINLPSIS